jgi:hypothetical protein
VGLAIGFTTLGNDSEGGPVQIEAGLPAYSSATAAYKLTNEDVETLGIEPNKRRTKAQTIEQDFLNVRRYFRICSGNSQSSECGAAEENRLVSSNPNPQNARLGHRREARFRYRIYGLTAVTSR